MRITPVNTYQYSAKRPVFKGVVEDFGKKTKEVFIKTKIDAEDEITLKRLLIKAFDELITPERFLGGGFFGEVYSVDKDLAAKISKGVLDSHEFLQGGIKLGKRVFAGLKTYYGEALGQIGRIEILRNLGEHIPAGIPSKEMKKMNSLEECEKYYQEKYLPVFAKVPQESYDTLIKDIAALNGMKYSKDEYYVFDSRNPGNIVLSGGKLLLTDGMDTINLPECNTVGKVLEAMLYKLTSSRMILDYGNHVEDAREILCKIITASEKADLPYDTRLSDENIWKCVLLNCNINMKADSFIQGLEFIRGRNPDLKKRLPKIEQYLDNVFKNNGRNHAKSYDTFI